PQKASVIVGPTVLEAGTTMLNGRQVSNVSNGSSHLLLNIGPRGPLNEPGWRSPQRPPYSSQANSPSAVTSLGIRMTSRGVRTDSGAEISHPNPELRSPQARKVSLLKNVA